MNWKSLLLLLIVAAAAVWGVVELNKTPDAATSVATEQVLLPGFAEKANDVDSVRVSKAGDETVAGMKRNEQGWVVSNKNDYPADVEKIRSLLLDLVDAKIIETKTANPEYYERLGVTDISDEKATGTQLELAAGDERISLIVGSVASGGSNGTYVRRSGEEQSYLIGSTIALSADSQQWLQQPIVEIPFERVQRVTIQHPDGDTLTLVRENRDDKNVMISAMPEGRELSYETAANPTASALANLRLEDVVPAAEFKPEQTDAISVEYATFDGVKLTAKLYKQVDKYYVALQSAFDEEQAAQFAKPAAEGESSEEKPTAADAGEEQQASTNQQAQPAADKPDAAAADTEPVREEAEALNQRLSGWVYAISEFKYESMSKRLEDMLKPLENTQEDDQQDNAGEADSGLLSPLGTATEAFPSLSPSTMDNPAMDNQESETDTEESAADAETTVPGAEIKANSAAEPDAATEETGTTQ